jgi:hypothetical protein
LNSGDAFSGFGGGGPSRIGPSTTSQGLSQPPAGLSQSNPVTGPPGTIQDLGFTYPLVRIRSNQSALSLSVQPFSKTSLVGNVRYDRMDFGDLEQPDPATSGSLQDDAQLTAGLSITRQVGPLGSLGASYAHSRTGAGDFRGKFETLTADWSRQFGSRVGFLLSGSLGATRADFASQEEARFLLTWQVGVGLSVPQARRGIPFFQFSRSVTPAYGLGRDTIANQVTAGYTRILSRSATLVASGSYDWNKDPTDPSLDFSNENYSIGFQFGARGLTTSMSYVLRRTDIPLFVDRVLSHSATVSIGYGWQFR